MLRNILKVAFRNLVKNKAFSFINIFGLAAGLTCFLLMVAFVYNELTYDRFPSGSENMYRVNLGTLGNGSVSAYPMVDAAVGGGMKSAFPEIRDFTRMSTGGDLFVKYNDRQFKESKLAYADANALSFFSIPLADGNNREALVQPNSIVLSAAMAKKYFGDAPAIGRSLLIGGKDLFRVTGLFDKLPSNAHFHFDAFLSLSTIKIAHPTWTNLGFYTYLLLNKNADYKKLEAKFPQLVEEYAVPEIQQDMGVSLAEAKKSVNTFIFSLQPLRDIHLHSNTKYEIEPNGDIQYVYIFSALAFFILLLACINFTNLSTARALKRAREVGIRKVLGSLKKQLIWQFLAESMMVTMLAMILSFAMIYLLLPWFNQLAGKEISFGFFAGWKSLLPLLALTALVGLLAGIYPSFFLSSFNTIKVLKGSALNNNRRNTLRSSLVVFQFFVSTALIIATIVVYQQLHFMQNKKLGYNKEQVVYIPDAYFLGSNQDAFRNELLRDNRVVSASISRQVPGSVYIDGTEIYPKNSNGNGATIHSNIYHVDYDFLKTFGMEITTGRFLSKDFRTDSTAVVINEAAVAQLGWGGSDPVGKQIVRSGQKQFTVVGVVKDFHYASVKQKIAPLMMILGNNYGGLVMKIKARDVRSLLGDLKTHWDAYAPAGPFSYRFMDDQFAGLYKAEINTGRIFTAFTTVAILIACLGLFGLAAFITEQRTKEIGIRKVLGAPVKTLLLLVSKDFMKLVALAFIIAIPIAWWAMQYWLDDFAYRIRISPWIFLSAGLAATGIALLTISFQAIRAAIANPIRSLRAE